MRCLALALPTHPFSQYHSEQQQQPTGWQKIRWIDSPETGKSLWMGSNLSDSVSRYQSANTIRSDSIATCPPTISLRRILQQNAHESSRSLLWDCKTGELDKKATRLNCSFVGRERTQGMGSRPGLGWQLPPFATFPPRTCVGGLLCRRTAGPIPFMPTQARRVPR